MTHTEESMNSAEGAGSCAPAVPEQESVSGFDLQAEIREAEAGSGRAAWRVGSAYESGEDAPQDHAEAVRWYERAVALGEESSLRYLAEMAADGRGMPRDIDKAVSLYRKNAERFTETATYVLAAMHADGIGVEKDAEKALAYYRAGWEPEHFGELAECYEQGRGVEQDYARALDLYRAGAYNRVPAARKALPRLLLGGKGGALGYLEGVAIKLFGPLYWWYAGQGMIERWLIAGLVITNSVIATVYFYS